MKAQKVFRSLGMILGGLALFFVGSLIITLLGMLALIIALMVEAEKNGVQIPIDQIVMKVFSENNDVLMSATFFGDILAVVLIIGVAVALAYTGKKMSIKDRLSLNPIPKVSVPLLILFGIALNAFVILVMELLPIPSELMEDYGTHVSALEGNTFYTVLAVVIAAPLSEEILCRSVFLKEFRNFMPTWLAVIFSSAIFGFMHGNAVQFAYTSVTALALAAVFLLFDSVYASILVHFGFNAASYLFTWLLIAVEDACGVEEDSVAANIMEFTVLIAIAAMSVFPVLYFVKMREKQKAIAVKVPENEASDVEPTGESENV